MRRGDRWLAFFAFPHRAVMGLCLMALLGCHTPGQQAASAPPPGLELRCHYLQGQKYAAEQDPRTAAAWLEDFCKRLTAGDEASYDLFSHGGGGPAGAEWNSDGSLVIVARIPAPDAAITDARLLLNGNPWPHLTQSVRLPEATCHVFQVPGPDWTARLRPINSADHALLYTAEDLAAKKSSPNGPVGVGEVLQVAFSCRVDGKNWRILRAFHVAYGE